MFDQPHQKLWEPQPFRIKGTEVECVICATFPCETSLIIFDVFAVFLPRKLLGDGTMFGRG